MASNILCSNQIELVSKASPSFFYPHKSCIYLDGTTAEKISFGSMMSTMPPPPPPPHCHEPSTTTINKNTVRLNKFVRRLHEMLSCEQGRGVVEWKRGVLVLHSINTIFAKEILPKYFGTRNFKTFRRQLNYYGEI